MAKNKPTGLETDSEIEEMLYAAHAEIKSFEDLMTQRGTPIPALFSQYFKFINNPSTVSVETFKRMVDTDDTVGSGVDFLTTCLAARLGRYTHPSSEITEFVNKAFDRIEGGFNQFFKELMAASWTGYMVMEKVWENAEEGFFVRKIVPLPPGTIMFETDRTGDITEDGILQYQRNYNPQLIGQGLGFLGTNLGMSYGFDGINPDAYAKLGDFPYPLRVGNTYNYLSIRIPRTKCIHYAFNAQGKFGNPYGRSLLRRCYHWYTLKHAFVKMLAVALDRKGTPLTVVFADPNTTLLDSKQFNPSKAPGEQKKMRADLAAAEAFKNIHNDSVIFLPGKKDQIFGVETITQQSNANDFMAAIDMCNKSILRGLLIPSLIFGNGDGSGSYSLGQEHSKTFDKILDGHLDAAKQVVLQQYVKELIAYNFPESAWKKDGLGDFAKRELTKDEIDKEMDVFEKGINAGVIDVNDLNDLNQMREVLGFEPKDEMPLNIPDNGEVEDQVESASGGASGTTATTSTGGTDLEDTAYNGAQVSALKDVILAVSQGEIPKTSAELILQKGFQFSPEEAKAVLADVKEGSSKPEPQPSGAMPVKKVVG